MVLCPLSVLMAAPKLFSKGLIVEIPLISTDGGKKGVAAVIYFFPEYEPPILQFKELSSHSPQYKELYVIYLALKEVKGPLNLFSVSVYAVNLLLWLSISFIKLDANPLSPLLIQVSTLLQERDSPIYIQHV